MLRLFFIFVFVLSTYHSWPTFAKLLEKSFSQSGDNQEEEQNTAKNKKQDRSDEWWMKKDLLGSRDDYNLQMLNIFPVCMMLVANKMMLLLAFLTMSSFIPIDLSIGINDDIAVL